MCVDLKLSIFNNKILVKQHTIIYNSFTEKTVIIRDYHLTDLNDLKMLSKNDNSLYNNLIEAGVLVNKNIDESNALHERILERINNQEEYILHINPTLDCNFHCWYCYENHVPRSKMSEEILNRTKFFISRIVKNEKIKHLNLSFFGGEPLLYFETSAKELIIHADKLCKEYNTSLQLSFTSNGYALSDRIIQWLANYSCGFQITLDGGRDCHNATRFSKPGSGTYDRIVDNILKLAKNGIRVIVRINYTSKNIDSVENILNSFSNLSPEIADNLSFDFQRVWQDRDSKYDITENKVIEIRDSFSKKGFTVHSNHIIKSVKYPCYADKLNYSLINYNGDVFGCTARDFTKKNRIGILDESGEIHYDDEELYKRRKAKYTKAICQTCRIAPLCGGGCNQKSFEFRDSETCTLGYNEEEKDNIIIDVLDWNISEKLISME